MDTTWAKKESRDLVPDRMIQIRERIEALRGSLDRFEEDISAALQEMYDALAEQITRRDDRDAEIIRLRAENNRLTSERNQSCDRCAERSAQGG